MKATTNFQLPYPECDPPLVEDAADGPRDLYNLAQATNTAFAALDLSVSNGVFMDHAEIRGPSSQVLAPGQQFTLPTISNANGITVSNSNVLTIRQAGLYMIVGYAQTGSNSGLWHRLDITINGIIFRSSSISIVSGGLKNNVIYPRVLNVGDQVGMSQQGPASLTYTVARLSAVAMVYL